MTTAEYLPERITLESLREAAKLCHGCDLWRNATQTVFGEGPDDAQLMFVGEQRVTKQRGTPVDSTLAEVVIATIHPSAILRAEDRDAEYAGFVDDLERVAALL